LGQSPHARAGSGATSTASAPFTLAADNGNVYKPSDAGVWGAAVLPERDATQHYFPHDRIWRRTSTGRTSRRSRRTDRRGRRWASDAPTVAPTASAVAGGSLIVAHTYEVSYSYQDDELVRAGQRIGHRCSRRWPAPNLTVRVSVTASTDAQVDKIVALRARRDGRRDGAPEGTPLQQHHDDARHHRNTWRVNEAPTITTVPSATLGWAVVWKNRWWAWIRQPALLHADFREPQSGRRCSTSTSL
jgi:predicted lipoprotein with Yx(FWY)xxD motif